MDNIAIGSSVIRWDAVAKVTGKANYTSDIPQKEIYHGKIYRAKITHGMVKSIDIREALKVVGVVKILTADDVSSFSFPTAGHPYNLDPKLSDKADRRILTKHVRLYGDEIAAVIAKTELAAEEAIGKIKVEYEEYEFYLTPEEALKKGAVEIHEGTKNVIADTVTEIGDLVKGFEEADIIVENNCYTPTVQHCQMENQIAYSYKDVDGRWVCVTSTQIPHICKRVLGQAFGMPWGRFRVIKPFVGGGFGNKQDVTIEPLVVAMSMSIGGKPVILDLHREEVFSWTRVRHAISYKMKMGFKKDGQIIAGDILAISNNGAYASHGHSVVAKGGGMVTALYKVPNFKYHAKTVYTNIAAAGAMRGYGVPQITYAMETFMDKAARELGMDIFDLREINMTKPMDENPVLHMTQYTMSLRECIELGKKKFNWDKRKQEIDKLRKENKALRGLGIAAFAYTSGTYPKGLEIAGCRLVLNQDGSIKIMLGATEIGQGSDTVFSQMVAETLGIPVDQVYVDQLTDTDISPFDTGAYASRQTFVTGMAVKKAAEKLKEKILQACCEFDEKVKAEELDIFNGKIVNKNDKSFYGDLGELSLKCYYHLNKGLCLTADVSNKCVNNAYPYGITFVDLEIDKVTGKVKINDILNVHDSGKIINPLMAIGQVEGGMAMGIAYALDEELKYDDKTGKPLNNNLLDYKMPTMMDMPDLMVAFVEKLDPIGPYGNKALGEPPTCSPAPAIRNAIVDALGVEINEIPITPRKIMEILHIKNKEV